MDWRKTTLACVALSCGLTACGTTPQPKTVPELHFVVCPTHPPGVTCPTYALRKPVHPYEVANELLTCTAAYECVVARNVAWQDSYAGCLAPH